MSYKIIGIPFCSNLLNNKEPNITPNKIKVDEIIEVDNLNKDVGLKQIEEKTKNVERSIFLGGDHSISYALVKAIKPDLLVVFDAHADLIKATATITNEDWLRALINESIIKPSNVLIIGLRNYDKQEMDFIKQNSIAFFNLDREEWFNMDDVADFIMEKIKDKQRIYLSIDIDVINGSEINANFKEPFGFSSREMLYILQRIAKLKEKVIAIDIVEAIASHDLTKKIVESIIKLFNE